MTQAKKPDTAKADIPRDLHLRIKSLSRTDGRRIGWHIARAVEEYLERVESETGELRS
jgi:predicted DNA-binding protein